MYAEPSSVAAMPVENRTDLIDSGAAAMAAESAAAIALPTSDIESTMVNSSGADAQAEELTAAKQRRARVRAAWCGVRK